MKASSLVQRVRSALVLAPLTIALIWWSPWSTALAVAALTVVGLRELYGAFAQSGHPAQIRVGSALALLLAASPPLSRLAAFDLALPVVALGVMGTLAATLPQHSRKGVLAEWGLTLAGALYIAILAMHITLLRLIETPLEPAPLASLGMASGAGWLYLVCAVTWLQDSLAYFVGRTWGRRRMTPSLSPKKTWEGAAGGMAGAILGGVLAVMLCGLPISIWTGAALGVVGGIVGPIGDLAESMIKRQAGLKDAGHLIPGHGGALDRIDSLLFTAPALYYLILLLVR